VPPHFIKREELEETSSSLSLSLSLSLSGVGMKKDRKKETKGEQKI
jgi:hypothetical protein